MTTEVTEARELPAPVENAVRLAKMLKWPVEIKPRSVLLSNPAGRSVSLSTRGKVEQASIEGRLRYVGLLEAVKQHQAVADDDAVEQALAAVPDGHAEDGVSIPAPAAPPAAESIPVQEPAGQVPQDAARNRQCPECGSFYKGGAGLGAHRSRAHGVPGTYARPKRRTEPQVGLLQGVTDAQHLLMEEITAAMQKLVAENADLRKRNDLQFEEIRRMTEERKEMLSPAQARSLRAKVEKLRTENQTYAALQKALAGVSRMQELGVSSR